MDWLNNVECKNTPVNMWFPSRGVDLTPLRKICKACPVRIACLEDALNTRSTDDFGFRGGMSERQRNIIRRTRKEGLKVVA